jgi:hypothetical protein
MKQEGCSMKHVKRHWVKTALISCLVLLGLAGCKKTGDQTDVSAPVQSGVEFEGGAGPGGGAGYQPPDPNVGGNVPPPSSACGDGNFADLSGNPVEPTAQGTFFEFYNGGSSNVFANAVDSMSSGGTRVTALNQGNRILIFNGDNVVSPAHGFDSGAGQVHALKFFDGNRLAIGSTGHFRVCNLNGGNLTECTDFKGAGGITNIAYDGASGNFYLTTMAGDFVQLSKDSVGQDKVCARLIYRAADHMDNRALTGPVPYRAFRAGVANGLAYFLVRNNLAKASFDLNALIDSMIEWFSSGIGDILTRRTKLYSYNPGGTSLTEITVPGSNDYRYFMDDLTTGPDNNLHVSYWAPTERDIVHINNCGNVTPCTHNGALNPGLVWFAYFLNTKSGILKVDNNQTVIEYYLQPLADITGNNYCDPTDYAAFPNISCLRIPNIGLFFVNRLASNENGVYMSGLFGLAWLKDGQIKSEIQDNTKGLLLDMALSFDLASPGDTKDLSYAGRWDFGGSFQPTFWHYTLVDFFTMNIDPAVRLNSTKLHDAVVFGAGKDILYLHEGGSVPVTVQYIGTGIPPSVTELKAGPSGTSRKFEEYFEVKTVQGQDRILFFSYDFGTSQYYLNFSDLTQSEPRATWLWDMVNNGTLAALKTVTYLVDGNEQLYFFVVAYPTGKYTVWGKTLGTTWPPAGGSYFGGAEANSFIEITGEPFYLMGAEPMEVNGAKEYWAYTAPFGTSPGISQVIGGVHVTKFTQNAPPTDVFIQHNNAITAAFNEGKVYILTGDGALHVYDVAGGNTTSNSPNRTIEDFVKLPEKHEIWFGTMAYSNGHIIVGSVTGAMAPTLPRTDVNFLGSWGDEQPDGSWISYSSDVQPYLFVFGQEGVLTGAGVFNGRGDQFLVPAQTP